MGSEKRDPVADAWEHIVKVLRQRTGREAADQAEKPKRDGLLVLLKKKKKKAALSGVGAGAAKAEAATTK